MAFLLCSILSPISELQYHIFPEEKVSFKSRCVCSTSFCRHCLNSGKTFPKSSPIGSISDASKIILRNFSPVQSHSHSQHSCGTCWNPLRFILRFVLSVCSLFSLRNGPNSKKSDNMVHSVQMKIILCIFQSILKYLRFTSGQLPSTMCSFLFPYSPSCTKGDTNFARLWRKCQEVRQHLHPAGINFYVP